MKSLILLLAQLLALGAVSAGQPLTLTQTIPLPGVKGKFDHMAVDATNARLFVAAQANNTLEVIDLKAGRHLQSVEGMAKPCGVLYVQPANRVLVANFDDAILGGTVGAWNAPGPFDGFCLGLHVDDPVPGDEFLAFGKRAVDNRNLAIGGGEVDAGPLGA